MRRIHLRPSAYLALPIALLCLINHTDFVSSRHSILDYGAVYNKSDTESAFHNSAALVDAVRAANRSQTDREVYIPGINSMWFNMMPVNFTHLNNITLTIDGTVQLSDDDKNWPYIGNNTHNAALDFLHIEDSSNIHIRGNGTIDGNGYWWWMREYIVANKHGRPHILSMNRVQHCIIEGVNFHNSPRYHMFLTDIDDFLIQNLEVKVDIFEQKKLAIQHGFFNYKLNLPTFPLNTDGIDPAGSNILIRNVNITSYDDSIAVKPSRQDYKLAKCSENITADNLTTWMGVGMTIGTVPPNPNTYCVRNVTFKNIHFWYPIKAVYVKTNPGDKGDGIIENILYENLTIVDPIWWTIYIGPQQQYQPDGRGPGCMLYPLLKDCETQPRITVRNITLRNIESTGGFLPGIIRCNESNPCTGINFENVHHRGLLNQKWANYGFITENAYGSVINSYPDPHIVTGEPKQYIDHNIVQAQRNQQNIDFYSAFIADKFAGSFKTETF